MILITSDEKRTVDIGSYEIWKCLYSTVAIRLDYYADKIPLALAFLKTGRCIYQNANDIARQINLVRDALAAIPPEKAVYDADDITRNAPWFGNLSPVITSCNTMFTTADGKDLLYELVCILCYAGIREVDISER